MRFSPELYTKLGAEFVTPHQEIISRLSRVKAYIFDWDGVFNSGAKGGGTISNFSEGDAMGTNLLRLGHWLRFRSLPFVGIVTGQLNPAAVELTKRERFNAVYSRFINKVEVLEHLEKNFNIQGNDVAFVFDDVIDLSLARFSLLRLMVRRSASPEYLEYAREKRLVDYISAHQGGENAVREICELLLSSTGMYERTVNARVEFSGEYSEYLSLRNQIDPAYFKKSEEGIVSLEA